MEVGRQSTSGASTYPPIFLRGGRPMAFIRLTTSSRRLNGVPALSLSRIERVRALRSMGFADLRPVRLLHLRRGRHSDLRLGHVGHRIRYRVRVRRSRFACRHSGTRRGGPGQGMPGRCRLRRSFRYLVLPLQRFGGPSDRVAVWAPEPTVTVLTGAPGPSTSAMMVLGLPASAWSAPRRRRRLADASDNFKAIFRVRRLRASDGLDGGPPPGAQ